MAKLLEFTDKREGTPDVAFYCPGCKTNHGVWIEGSTKNPMNECTWTFNGDFDKPTFVPSILVRWSHENKTNVCHSYVKGGMIQFLDDCTHDLKGQTVELPELT